MEQNTTPEYIAAEAEAWGRLMYENETGFTADPFNMFEAGWFGHAKQSEELDRLTKETFEDLQSRYNAAHAELLAIHDILMCVGECPEPAPEDTFCVSGVKQLAQRVHQYL